MPEDETGGDRRNLPEKKQHLRYAEAKSGYNEYNNHIDHDHDKRQLSTHHQSSNQQFDMFDIPSEISRQ